MSSLHLYLYVLAVMLIAFVATNVVLRNPVHAFGIESVSAAIGSGVLAYYYINVYNTTVSKETVVVADSTTTVSSPIHKDSADGYEKVQTGFFPTEPKS
jgi:uncharacterized PurR-regulated membrane protein YhhQ (DUF165 family)